VRKVIERVFGMLKKRFRILKIPLPYRDIKLVADIVHCFCILHNMILEDKGRMNIGHLQGDWIDKGPDASKARREIYDKANGHTFLLNGRTYITNDHTDYTLRVNQTSAPDYCDATKQPVPTRRCSEYVSTRSTLVNHYSIVSDIFFSDKSTDKSMCLEPTSQTRPFP
jgi:hypothetical protein